MPDRLKAEVASNPLGILLHLRDIRTVSTNVQTIAGLPERTSKIIVRIKNQVQTIASAFGVNWKLGG
jgi:hypothetical protein